MLLVSVFMIRLCEACNRIGQLLFATCHCEYLFSSIIGCGGRLLGKNLFFSFNLKEFFLPDQVQLHKQNSIKTIMWIIQLKIQICINLKS